MVPCANRFRHAGHPEKDYLHPGQDDHTVFDTEFARCGMLVCWGESYHVVRIRHHV